MTITAGDVVWVPVTVAGVYPDGTDEGRRFETGDHWFRVGDELPAHPALPGIAGWLAAYPDAADRLRRRHALGWDPCAYDGQPEGLYRADCAAIEALIAALEGME